MDPCRCGACCEHLAVEASPDDARREPAVAALGAPLYAQQVDADGGWTPGDVVGYLLNRPGGACLFYSRDAEGLALLRIAMPTAQLPR